MVKKKTWLFLAGVATGLGLGWKGRKKLDNAKEEARLENEKLKLKRGFMSVEEFNQEILEPQKKAIEVFLTQTEMSKSRVLDYFEKDVIKEESIYFNHLDQELAKEILKICKEENVSARLVTTLAVIETNFGYKEPKTNSPRGPLRVKNKIIYDNCSDLINKYESKTKFLNSKDIQIRAGIRQLKNIAEKYKISIKYDEAIKVDDVIILLVSYNKGIGKFKYYPFETLLYDEETRNFVADGLVLFFKYKNFIIDNNLKI